MLSGHLQNDRTSSHVSHYQYVPEQTTQPVDKGTLFKPLKVLCD